MIKNLMLHQIKKEYLILFFGIAISAIFNYVYTFFYDLNNINSKFTYANSGYAIIITVGYIFMTGYIFLLFSPILGFFYKKNYKYFFNLLMISNLFWVYRFISDSEINLTVVIILIASPIPLSYIVAWRNNTRYWNLKEITTSQ